MTLARERVGEVLKLQRRAVLVEPDGAYEEIGVRSFGRGIFHKEPVTGLDLGAKRVFHIEPNDLVISNVFAWEGAISVASEADAGKIGSHRFMSFVSRDDRIDTRWAAWFFLSEPGLELIRKASPGSAGRNRTLAIDRFEALEIPLPHIDEQRAVALHLERTAHEVNVLERRSRNSHSAVTSTLLSWLESRFENAGVVTTLAETAAVLRGRGPRYQPGSGQIAINQACVRWDGIDLSRAREVENSWWLDVPDAGRVQGGDVLVNSTGEGTIGRAALADDAAAGLPFDSHVLTVRCDLERLLPGYLAAYLRSPSGEAQVHSAKGANTTKQTELGKHKLERLQVPTPSIGEQAALLEAHSRLSARAAELETILRTRNNRLHAMLPAALNEAFADLS